MFVEGVDAWTRLRELFPWPVAQPATKPLVHGWMDQPRQWAVLLDKVPENGIIVEVGAWTGKTSLYVLEMRPDVRFVAVDIWTETPPVLGEYWLNWRASGQMGPNDTPLSLYQANTWEYRERAVTVQADSVAGMLAVAQLGLRPGLVYIDANHGQKAVERDVSTAGELFGPDAVLSGHDYVNNDGTVDCPVSRAVNALAEEWGYRVEHIGKVWWYE